MKKELFEFERNKHINEQFAGVVPRVKGDMKSDPIGYMFDQYWKEYLITHGFDGTSTPDTMVLEKYRRRTHIGAYTGFIKKRM